MTSMASPQTAPPPRADFFKFLTSLNYDQPSVSRMNWRYQHVIDPVAAEIDGSTVLDLGSHDGRWPAAFVNAGAEHVIGIEGRQNLIDQFQNYPKHVRDKVALRKGDFVQIMDEMLASGDQFDVIGCLGVYYHTMHHYRMMCQMAAFKPKLIIIDSEFADAKAPVITMVRESTGKNLNTIEQVEGQQMAPVGMPSIQAIRVMAESVGYQTDVLRWEVPENARSCVNDYFTVRQGKIRGTLFLRPIK